MLSAITAATMVTSVSAFDSDINGKIYSKTVVINPDTNVSVSKYYASNYYMGENAANDPANDHPLKLSQNSQYGDALIYPKFTVKGSWTTDISVRNSSDNAVVAKVVLYAADDSRELRDFNIYLSGNDVFTFNISKDGNVTTQDGSYPKETTQPKYGSSKDNAIFVNDKQETHSITTIDSEQEGYIVIYGMAQSDFDAGSGKGYHNKHNILFKDYRQLIDHCRGDDWRAAYNDSSDDKAAFIKNGMLSTSSKVKAPNLILSDCIPFHSSADNGDIPTFSSVKPVLAGTVRLSNNDANVKESRDLILPATALSNFSDDIKNIGMLWTEGEYAAIQDRRIDGDKYDVDGIKADAKAFEISSTEYTYNSSDSANQLIFTQPMKRILVQTGNADYYSHISRTDVPVIKENDASNIEYFDIVTSYGCFYAGTSIFNENEQVPGSTPKDTTIKYSQFISPYTTTQINKVTPDCKFKNELQVLTDTDLQDKDDNLTKAMNQNGGFVKVNITSEDGTQNSRIPAIITQMIGSTTSNGSWQTNWVYAPTK